jgi:virulence factor Mce-like protein
MRRVLLSAAIVLAAAAFLVVAGGSSNGPSGATYKIEFDNAFGLVNGADFKVAGVRAGTIQSIDLDQKTLRAVVTVKVTQPGFGQFRSDAFCQSRPQSLIGEYFVDCQPGQYGQVLKPGSTIDVTRTQSTIPTDLVQNIMRLPYRQRFTLIINELGAAVAGRSDDLQAALRRAVPALTETDNLLNLLANDSATIRDLNANADSVITALANNSAQVQRFIVEANNAATDTAAQQTAFQATWHKLPGFLQQLKPALADLGTAVDANYPVLQNLNSASGNLKQFFSLLVPFSRESLPSLRSLGNASKTGKSAIQAAGPLVSHLNQFAKPNPELAQNLAIVLHDLDDRSRAVEPDPRSPGGKGFTGLEAVLQYVFNQALAIDYFGPFGHMLAVDAFANQLCSPYATPRTIASSLSSNGAAYRQCYSWIGPNQPGINEQDPSNPHGCVPDPGGEPPPGTPYVLRNKRPTGPAAPCKLSAADASGQAQPVSSSSSASRSGGAQSSGPSASATAQRTAGAPGAPKAPAINLSKTLGQILSFVGGATSGASSTLNGASSGNQTAQLLNYLLAP